MSNASDSAAGSVSALMREIGSRARSSAHALGTRLGARRRIAPCAAAARALRARKQDIIAANARDLEAAENAGATKANLDRLMLDDARIEAVARGVEDIAGPARSRRPRACDLRAPERPRRSSASPRRSASSA